MSEVNNAAVAYVSQLAIMTLV